MQIEYTDSYTKHGTNIHGRLAIVRYYQDVTNHDFNGAYRRGGVLDCLDEAKALIKKHHPVHTVVLAIPDLVVKLPQDSRETSVL
jgi:hypothetical protein